MNYLKVFSREAFQTLFGVTGSGKTFTMAHVIAELGRPWCWCRTKPAAQLYAEMREFFPDNAVEYFVSYYDYYQPEAYVPASDTHIEKDASINEHIDQMRLSATKAILEREDVIIVATVSAIYGLGDPVSYHGMILHLRKARLRSKEISWRGLQNFSTPETKSNCAEGLSSQGDVLDIFPAESERFAVRVELFGDEIETLRFDPLTGETDELLTRFTIYPKSTSASGNHSRCDR